VCTVPGPWFPLLNCTPSTETTLRRNLALCCFAQPHKVVQWLRRSGPSGASLQVCEAAEIDSVSVKVTRPHEAKSPPARLLGLRCISAMRPAAIRSRSNRRNGI
jgi:hypothetical protein